MMLKELDLVLEQDSNRADKAQRQILQSKLKSLNNHLNALLQKKVRIDIEIKNVKKKLSKLRTSAETYVKAKVELEGFDYEHFSQDDLKPLLEKIGIDEYQELFKLDSEIYLAEQNLSYIEDLPLYEE